MLAGYHTAGLLLHDPIEVIGELAHLGYSATAIRPHAGMLHPDRSIFGQQVLRLADARARAGIALVIDLDAKFVRDPFDAEGPSLMSRDESDSAEASAWVCRWIEIAAEVGASLVTFASGPADESPEHLIGGENRDQRDLERLAGRIDPLLDAASSASVRLALCPRAGDVIASVAQFERLRQWLGDRDIELGLAADVGQMLSSGEMPVSDRLIRNLETLACVYLCDRRSGATGDQPIGEGDVAVPRIVGSLRRAGFTGPGIVRVTGHESRGLGPARQATAVFQ